MPDYQSAYRALFSTRTALVCLYHDILQWMESQQLTLFIVLDLSAPFHTVNYDVLSPAFHTVNYDVLLQVLEARSVVKMQFKNWLTHISPGSWMYICQVWQGSCLGLVLLSIYSSTLKDIILENVGVRGYADDNVLDIAFTPTAGDEKTLRGIVHQWNLPARTLSNGCIWIASKSILLKQSLCLLEQFDRSKSALSTISL